MLLLLLLWLLFIVVVVVAVVEATTVFCFLAMQADVLFLTFVPFAEKNVVSLSSEIVSSSSSSTTLMSTSRGEKGSSLIVVDSKKEELRRFWLEKKNSNDVTGLKIWQQKVFISNTWITWVNFTNPLVQSTNVQPHRLWYNQSYQQKCAQLCRYTKLEIIPNFYANLWARKIIVNLFGAKF